MGRFDAYRTSYAGLVESSVAFSGLKHDFFVRAKIALLADLFSTYFAGVQPSLLDVGCGIGLMHRALKPLVSALAGTDPSSEALARAADENPQVDYRAPSAKALPWEDGAFDVTLAVCVFHHVPRDERVALLAEMRRLTRQGGLVIVIEHNPWHPLTRLAVARCPFDADAKLLDPRAGRALMRSAAAFQRVRVQYFLMVPLATRWSQRLERVLGGVPIGAQYALVGEA